ncbi:MAG: mediator of RNA polymerase II transcription subunit 6 [Nitrososphaerota archaeon]|jgi:hypothetical protein|nr:mediator of RNA polymerase II transcription subunit 6 [Nitrososphaerota archaeon]
MIEKVSKDIEIYHLKDTAEIKPVVDAIMNGKITLLKLGSVFSFILNPNIADLADKFNLLKARQSGQVLSVVCTYEQAKQIVDRERVNDDFFRIPAYFCSRVIVRIPVDTSSSFPHDKAEGTMQFLSFEEMHPIHRALKDELFARGCEHMLITSGNIHGAPTIEDLVSAKMLTALFNIEASFLGMPDVETIVADISESKGIHKGSYIILSFCNKDAIEVKRLANKVDREVTEKYLEELFTNVHTQTPLEYTL